MNTYIQLLNAAENFAADIAKQYIEAIEATAYYGSNDDNEALRKIPSRFSVRGNYEHTIEDVKSLCALKPHLVEIVNAITQEVVENDSYRTLNDQKCALEKSSRVLEKKLKLIPPGGFEYEKTEDQIEKQIKQIKDIEHQIGYKLQKNLLPILEEDLDLAKRIRLSNDRLWIEKQIKEGTFHIHAIQIPSRKHNLFLPTIQALGISKMLSKLKPIDGVLNNNIEYAERTKKGLETLNEQPNIKKKKNIKSQSYMDYIKQDNSTLSHYFQIAVEIASSFFSGTIKDRMEDCNKRYGHYRFWNNHKNIVESTTNAQVQIGIQNSF
jgi:hypothetical protein